MLKKEQVEIELYVIIKKGKADYNIHNYFNKLTC